MALAVNQLSRSDRRLEILHAFCILNVYFRTTETSPSAEEWDALKAAALSNYKPLSLKCHPDLNGDASTERFKWLGLAKEILSKAFRIEVLSLPKQEPPPVPPPFPDKTKAAIASWVEATALYYARDSHGFYKRLADYARVVGYKEGWAAHQYKARCGAWPPWDWRD